MTLWFNHYKYLKIQDRSERLSREDTIEVNMHRQSLLAIMYLVLGRGENPALSSEPSSSDSRVSVKWVASPAINNGMVWFTPKPV